MIQIGARPANIDSPLDHLMACHRRIEQRLDTLVDAAGHIATGRAAALEAIRKSLHFLDTSGALHTEDEEASLFPRLRSKAAAEEIRFIDSLEAQHAEAESIYAELKNLAAALASPDECPPDLVQRYRECAARLRSLYGDHIRREDEVLMDLARRSLSESETSEITGEMRARRA